MRVQRIWLALIIALLLVPVLLSGCSGAGSFKIALTDTGDIVLTDDYIKAYDWQTHTIELNAKGIQKWNSFSEYSTIASETKSLFGKDFVVSLDGKELYRGRFLSNIVSSSYDGVVILDAILKRDNEHNTIQINFGYPSSAFTTGQDPRNNLELEEYLDKRGLLK